MSQDKNSNGKLLVLIMTTLKEVSTGDCKMTNNQK